VHAERAVQVLLVEDSDSDAELTRRALAEWRFSGGVALARDGEEALAFLFGPQAAAGGRSDGLRLVLLDLKLPRIGGFEVLRRIRADERTRHIPVVVLTSSDRDQDVQRAYALGANSFVSKPVGHEQFETTLRAVGIYWLSVNRDLAAGAF
jgi:two-component system, response regulator